MTQGSSLAERYGAALSRIRGAAQASGRDADDVRLIVVTKNHPAALVLGLLALGARDFGENRDQEAAPKAAEVRAGSAIEHDWHFVGQLQSNKVKSVLQYATSLHSLDRESLLAELIKQTDRLERDLDVFIELNLTDDPGQPLPLPVAHDEHSLVAVVVELELDRVALQRHAGAVLIEGNDLQHLERSLEKVVGRGGCLHLNHTQS